MAELSIEEYKRYIDELEREVDRLTCLINTPHTGDFLEAVKLEAAHQSARWGTEHDAGKSAADWFWLVGYLLGKALHFPNKREHHLISSAAALLNWFKQIHGESSMGPGAESPEEQ